MTGGGFGGCTVNLLKPDAVSNFNAAIFAAYRDRFRREPAIYPVQAADGASQIS